MHASVRPYVSNAAELYTALEKLQAHAMAALGLRALLLVALMAVGMLAPGAIGQVAWCLAAVTGVACVCSVADYAGRNSLNGLANPARPNPAPRRAGRPSH